MSRKSEYEIKLGRRVLDVVKSLVTLWNIEDIQLSPLQKELCKRFTEYQVNRIPEDEPVFVLRAQDVHAASTVRFWSRCVDCDPSADQELARDALGVAMEMEKWPVKKHPDSGHVRTVADVMGTSPAFASETTRSSTPEESTPSSEYQDPDETSPSGLSSGGQSVPSEPETSPGS